MKSVALILIFVGVSYALEDQCQGAYVKTIHEKCMLANGGDRAVIEDLIQFKKAEDENGQCFRDCVLRECKYYGGDGKLNPDVPIRVSQLLHGGDKSHMKPIEEATAKCVGSHIPDDSKCHNAESFYRCVAGNTPFKLKFYNVYD